MEMRRTWGRFVDMGASVGRCFVLVGSVFACGYCLSSHMGLASGRAQCALELYRDYIELHPCQALSHPRPTNTLRQSLDPPAAGLGAICPERVRGVRSAVNLASGGVGDEINLGLWEGEGEGILGGERRWL